MSTVRVSDYYANITTKSTLSYLLHMNSLMEYFSFFGSYNQNLPLRDFTTLASNLLLNKLKVSPRQKIILRHYSHIQKYFIKRSNFKFFLPFLFNLETRTNVAVHFSSDHCLWAKTSRSKEHSKNQESFHRILKLS